MIREFPTISLKTVLPAVQKIIRALPTPSTVITIDSACSIAGYTLMNNHHMEFLQSAKHFGLIEYNLQKDIFKISSFAISNFSASLLPNSDAIREAALSPDIFSELFTYFQGKLLLPPATILRASHKYILSDSAKMKLATTFSATMKYLYDNTPHHKTLQSPDGLVSVCFPSNMTKSQLKKVLTTMLN